jgi:type VI secretion system secreted protein Hcp
MAEMFLQLDNIDGESTDVEHPDEIEITGMDWRQNTFGANSMPGDNPWGHHGGGGRGERSQKPARASDPAQPSKNSAPQKAEPAPAADTGEAAKLDIKDFQIWKICDKASMNLLRYCCLGKDIKNGQITIRKLAGDSKLEYLVIRLYDIKISEFHWDWRDALLVEMVHLRVARFKVEYQAQSNDDGVAMGVVPYGFDVIHGTEATEA